jgi:hypothetical protein
MRILERLRVRSPRGDAGLAEASSAEQRALAIDRYDQTDVKDLITQLSQLSQIELAAVEAYERSHRERPVLLNRLRWLRGSEPLPGYDALDSGKVVKALADTDAETVKAVRSYERHHRARRDVLTQVARVLPTARASARQDRARETKAALVKAGIRSDPPADKTTIRHSPLDRVDLQREERDDRERLRNEARYRRERLDLYRARLYGGRAASEYKLAELERASEMAAARLRRAEATAGPTHQRT